MADHIVSVVSSFSETADITNPRPTLTVDSTTCAVPCYQIIPRVGQRYFFPISTQIFIVYCIFGMFSNWLIFFSGDSDWILRIVSTYLVYRLLFFVYFSPSQHRIHNLCRNVYSRFSLFPTLIQLFPMSFSCSLFVWFLFYFPVFDLTS